MRIWHASFDLAGIEKLKLKIKNLPISRKFSCGEWGMKMYVLVKSKRRFKCYRNSLICSGYRFGYYLYCYKKNIFVNGLAFHRE